MKVFIISILNTLGFGVGSMLPQTSCFFIGKLCEFVPNVNFEITNASESGFVVVANTSDDSFNIEYTYKEGTRIVKTIDIK